MNPSRTISPVARIVMLAFALLGGTLWLLSVVPGGTAALVPSPWWVAVLIAAGFALAEHSVFHLEHRREAITVTLSEVPTLYALAFLDLRVAIVARVVAGLTAVFAQRRPSLYKLVFNAGLFAFETAAAGAAIRWAEARTGTSVTWLLTLGVLAVGAVTAMGSVIVSAAIAQFEGGFLAKARNELVSNSAVYGLNASIAGLVLSPALIAPWFAPIACAPVIVFWLFLQRQAAIRQQLRDVEALHGFSGEMAGASDLDDIAHTSVREAAVLLRARRCTLLVGDVFAGYEPIAAVGTPIVLPDDLVLDPAVVSRTGAACAAPLVTERGIIGVLAIEEREGAADEFSDTDLGRLRTLANQLAAPVARGLMYQQLAHEARHDLLTGLANRASFERRLDTLLLETERRPSGATLFVAMFDLDRFKEVNDTLGHHAGDQLLVEVARRLERIVGPGDLMARFAGDEFGLVGVRDDIDDIDAIVRACVATVGAPCEITGLELVVNASAGVVTHRAGPGVAADPATLVRHADIAMYHAKQHHLGVEYYRPEIDRCAPARLSMLSDLRTALAHGEIELYFQPKLDLVADVVSGAEVLARWNHPVRGFVPPSDFVAVAEQSGLIRALTDQVLDGTVRAIAELERRGHRLRLAMNLSAHDLLDGLLCSRIEQCLDDHGVSPDRLTIEITEGTLLHDSPRTRENIAGLHAAGVRLSVDDFGTGYSSLSYLRQLPVSELKIDRSFITNLVVDAQDETIVRSTIDLGHNLGLQVVAEGVETSEVADRLRALGCDLAQGYGICRPVPFDQLISWLGSTPYGRCSDPADATFW